MTENHKLADRLTELQHKITKATEYGLVIHFKTNCLMYETAGYMKECKYTTQGEAQLDPHECIGHGFQETADHDITHTIHNELRKYIIFVNRNRALQDEMMEEEINPLKISVKKNGKENTPCMSTARK
jgi:hypothetical protein